MESKVIALIEQMETIRLSHEDINYSATQLLEDCPELKFDPSNKGRDNLWHDLQKKASQTGYKNIINYNDSDVEPMIEIECTFLLDVRIIIIKILRCIGADRNKGLILAVLKRLYGRNFSTGKNTPYYVRRVVVLLEKLSGVKAVTKRKPEEQPRPFVDWDALDDFDVNNLPPIEPPADQSPAKKQKTISEPAVSAAAATVPLDAGTGSSMMESEKLTVDGLQDAFDRLEFMELLLDLEDFDSQVDELVCGS